MNLLVTLSKQLFVFLLLISFGLGVIVTVTINIIVTARQTKKQVDKLNEMFPVRDDDF